MDVTAVVYRREEGCTIALFTAERAVRFRIPPGPYELKNFVVRRRRNGKADVYTIAMPDFGTAVVHVQRHTCTVVLYVGKRRASFKIPPTRKAKRWRAGNAEAYSMHLRLEQL